MKRGFTVIEVLVTILVMVILLGLGTVGLRASLANGRDAERQADIETIARGLETFYLKGNPYYIAAPSKGSYPGSNMKIHIDGAGWCDAAYFKNAVAQAEYNYCSPGQNYWSEFLIPNAAMTPPGKSGPSVANPWLAAQTDIPARIITNVNNGEYVYLPLDADNNHCYGLCPKFELYYKKETTGEVVKVKSVHQQ
ncbi:prepilin-type N-terminal cleavage/methylation domain-containing protein [Candidatus Saccharibacteria bacterium]|nr:prepilin-type N-terminal cleavage/methylation domain-containing protein [Candidatus Saccharibacteria bacterium]